jgi:tetratricopeptide (TPR) repeat protein
VLGDAASPKKVARIVEQAQGNALFLEELIRAVAEGQGDALPETVLMMMQARLLHLAPEARRVLRAASVLGDVFWQGAVTEMVGGKAHAAEVEARIADLVQKELLTRRRDSRFPGEIEHVFRHALVREAAYAMLTDEDRETGHRIAGTWLEQAGETRPSVLAEHFDRGGLAARAVPFYVRAAKQALEASDLVAVLARTERGLSLGATGEDRGRLLLAQAEAHRWREQMREAELAAEQAAAHLREGSAAWCLAMGELVTAQGKLTRRDLLVATSRKLLSFAETMEPPPAAPRAEASQGSAAPRAEGTQPGTTPRGEGTQPGTTSRGEGSRTGATPRAEGSQVTGTALRMEADLALITAMARAAIQAVYLGEGALARELLGRGEAIATARALDDPAILARHAQARGVLALYEGDMAGSARESERAIARYLLAGDLPSGCLERVNLGNAWTELGAYAEAEDETREALAAAERLGLRTVALAATINLGHLVAMSGRPAEGIALERSVADHPDQGSARFEIAARLYLARALEMAGRHAEAAAEAARVVDRTERVPPLRAYALATQARALLGCGEARAAHAAAQQAMDLLTSLGGVDTGEALIRLTYAESLSAVGRPTEATAVLAAARDRLLERAARIGDAGLRRQFLEVVPENARTISLAGQ